MSGQLFEPSIASVSHSCCLRVFINVSTHCPSFLALAALLAAAPVLADIRVVNAQGEHRMGDRDTKEDAIRLATEAAKRNALEQVATYLESVTVVSDMDVTKDEIRTYTAGLVIVLNQQISTTLDRDVVVIKADLLAQMDTDEVARAIVPRFGKTKMLVSQLAELKQENEQLQEELRRSIRRIRAMQPHRIKCSRPRKSGRTFSIACNRTRWCHRLGPIGCSSRRSAFLKVS